MYRILYPDGAVKLVGEDEAPIMEGVKDMSEAQNMAIAKFLQQSGPVDLNTFLKQVN